MKTEIKKESLILIGANDLAKMLSVKHTTESTGKLKEKLAEEIAGLLLFLQDTSLSQDQQTRCWALFESKLRRYVDLEVCGVVV